MMSEKRFQDCGCLVKLYRYRFYLLIPFKYIWYMNIKPFNVGVDEEVDGMCLQTDEYEVLRGKELWSTLTAISQTSMKWYYTTDEVFNRIKNER